MIRLRNGGSVVSVTIVVTAAELPRTDAGGPALPRKGTYWQLTKHGARPAMVPSRIAEGFVASLRAAAIAAGLGVGRKIRTPSHRRQDKPGDLPCSITAGLWRCHVHVCTPRTTELPSGELVPLIDSDACLTPVRDALQCAGVLDDDIRIVGDSTSRAVGPHAVHVTLTPADAPASQPLLPGLDPGDTLQP